MKLYFKKTGEGKPLFILHGLFGSGDNWSSLSKSFAENCFCCYAIDQRNHGRSPHSDEFTYEAMADDLFELIQHEHLGKVDIIGHSMGGKTAMFFAAKYPDNIEKLIIADMSPRYYAPHHQSILYALKSIDPESLQSRKEAEEKLRIALKDESTIQFLLKNLYWKEDNHLDWRFGLREIENNINNIGAEFKPSISINVPTLFIRGERSGYINESDEAEIKKIFLKSEIKTITGAGHWVHAEKPAEFLEGSKDFLKENLR
jgi:esterase